MYQRRYTSISRYDFIIHVHKSKFKSKNCTGEGYGKYFLNIDGIRAYRFYFLSQLHCRITQYRYLPLYPLMPPYSQRGRVLSTGMTLQTRTHPTVPHRHFCCQLRQKHYLRLPYRRVSVFNSTTMPDNVIIPAAHTRGSRVDHHSAEPLIMVPRLTVHSYSDPVVADKRRVLEYKIEPEGFPRVGEFIHLRWYEDKKCYLCRVVYYHPGKNYTTVIYCSREQYAIEVVSMRNRNWHYYADAHKAKRGEDPYDPTAYVRRILFFKYIPLAFSSNPAAPNAYVCKYLAPTNDICLH